MIIDTIKTLSELLSRDSITVQEVAKALGSVVSGGTNNVALTVKPSDAAIKDVRIVGGSLSDTPSHVDLTPAQPFPMRDLIVALGAYHTVPRPTNPHLPPRVRFDVDSSKTSHSTAIFASYDDEDDREADDSRVTGIMIRRD